MQDEAKSSITRLRSLREELCKKQKVWKEAFHVKDMLVTELKSLKELAASPDSTKESLSSKIDDLLILLDPARENGEEQ